MGVAEPSTMTLGPCLTREYLLHHQVCPRSIGADGVLVLATSAHPTPQVLEDMAFAYRKLVRTEFVEESDLERLIERLATPVERSLEVRHESDADDAMADVRDLVNQPPVVRYVNLILRDAYEASASDIHLEARRDGLSARFRLDGVLVSATEPPAELQQAIVSRVKLLADLDIAERRRPQDGRIRVRLENRELDIRVSTVPTMFGESVVLRLLDQGGRPVGFEDLGMSALVLAQMEQLTAMPHGMLLVTGPTGSGKTSTLYAALARRSVAAEKIVTVEDPVEYQLPGVTQVPVHAEAGVSFGSALRSILRQDPDVIMVGEMRDRETAEIAVQAAMTGHLVFSTLHTNDAPSALPRLLDLGIPDYLIAATVEGILAQRLVRRICTRCAEPYEPDPEQVRRLANGVGEDDVVFLHGTGCDECRGTGFRGRTGLFELLVVDDDVKAAITSTRDREDLRKLARRKGMRVLAEDGWQKVVAGATTVEEVLRVVQQ